MNIVCSSIAYVIEKGTTFSCLLLTGFSFLFASCASTSITDSWKDKDYQGEVQKVVVIMVAKSSDMRNLFEGRFVAELQARGINAIQSNKIVTLEELPDRELVTSKIKNTGADTVIISRLVGSKTMKSYVPGTVHTIQRHYYDWGTYYDIVAIDYGYTDSLGVAYIETNLYDTTTEQLIWSAQSKTERTEGEQQLINTFINIIIEKLASDKVIQ